MLNPLNLEPDTNSNAMSHNIELDIIISHLIIFIPFL